MEESRKQLNVSGCPENDAPKLEERKLECAQQQFSEKGIMSRSFTVEMSEILDAFEKMLSLHFSKLLNVFEDKIALDHFKEEQVRQLHNELQSYKTNLLAKAMRPLVIGMIRLHEDMGKMVDFFQTSDKDKLEHDHVLRSFERLQEDILNVLDQNGIIPYRELSREFNPVRQRVLRKVPTSDSILVGRIAESLRYGFEQGDMVIQKEGVAVYMLAEEG
jgi:molecular chaperone GrpE (heat shock protein)